MSQSEKVEFNAEEFKEFYPEFKNVPDAALGNSFENACLMLDNTKTSLVNDIGERKKLLYLLTAHIEELKRRGAGVVGLVTSASQGKISTGFSAPSNPNWYNQTQYGYMYWRSTQKYRIGGRYYAHQGRG